MTIIALGFALWGGLTAVLIGLLIYRSTLRLHQCGQIFLDDAEGHLAREQERLDRRITKLQPWVRGLGATSGTVIVVLAVVEVARLATV